MNKLWWFDGKSFHRRFGIKKNKNKVEAIVAVKVYEWYFQAFKVKIVNIIKCIFIKI